MDKPEKKCPKCAETIKEDGKFCGKCGADISTEHNCPQCNNLLQPNAKFCGGCGHQMKSASNNNAIRRDNATESAKTYIHPIGKRDSTVIALILSFFFPGAGQIYLRQKNVGIGLLIVSFVLWVTSAAILPGLLYFALLVALLISSYKDSKALQEGRPIHKYGFVWAKWKKEEYSK